jgi:8-oxo-dGTP diphosphatase
MFMTNLNNLKCIKTITDADFGIEPKPLNNPITRQGARGIVVRADGKIALFNKAKMNEYKLPGGGIEQGEQPDVAFAREVAEEVGCTVKNVKPLGYTVEEKGQTNFTQTSYVFVAELDKVLSAPNFTEKEINEGAQFIWVTPKQALKLVSESLHNLQDSPVDKYENVYGTSFMVVRDTYILDAFIKTQTLQKTNAKK